jgi:hypothetical protein
MLRLVRSNLVVLMVVASYLTTVALAVVLIDKAIYQRSKQSLIFESNWSEMLNVNISDQSPLVTSYSAYIQSTTETRREASLRQLQAALEDSIQSANGVWRMRAVGPGGGAGRRGRRRGQHRQEQHAAQLAVLP